jgi:predicted  nucleic acid-binding Zn-ribbon protein
VQSEENIKELEKIKVNLEEVKKSQEDRLEEIKSKMEKAVLEELDSLMEEFKKVKFDTIDINNKLSDINIKISYKNELVEDNIKEIASREKTIKEISSEFQQLKVEADKLIKAYSEKKEEVHKKEEIKRNEIFERWNNFFNEFTFEFNNLGNVVNFTREELLHIEECLYELHFTKDPMALSVGVIEDTDNKDEYQYIDVVFPDKFQVEILYKVLNNAENNVHIVEITTEF